jgi:hypothetical protein
MRIFVAIPLCHLALQALLFSFGASPAIAAPETIRIAVDRAVEVWRWQRYWDGESALDFAFSAPAPKRITLFWIEKSDALRFAVCKEDRTICVVPWLRPFSLAGLGATPAKKRFLSQISETIDSVPLRLVSIASFLTHPPAPLPPQSIREKRRMSSTSLKLLLGHLGCYESNACRRTVLIPFGSHSDQSLYVYLRCGQGCNREIDSILNLVPIPDTEDWFLGATSAITSPQEVQRMRQQIEAALQFRLDD